MVTELTNRKLLFNTDWTIIGPGNIGDKARQLVAKTPELKALGFKTPHRTILAEGFFNGFFKINGIGPSLTSAALDKAIVTKIKEGRMPTQDLAVLEKICTSHNNLPLMVRSSAEGDARGTGIYRSVRIKNDPHSLQIALQDVLASYFSESAINFRKDAQTGEGFGVIVEPVVGQLLALQHPTKSLTHTYAPILSGFGYTSPLKGEGFVNIVPGLGGSVNTRDGLKITPSALELHEGNLLQLMIEESFSGKYAGHWRNAKPALLRDMDSQTFSTLVDNGRNGNIRRNLNLPDDLKSAFNSLNLYPILSMARRMEAIFRNPQYYEWAMTIEDNKPSYSILQIADINNKVDQVEFTNRGEILLTAHTVTGTGIKECRKIARCWNPHDITGLHEFNRKNNNYVLIFPSRLTTAYQRKRLQYANISNAEVLIEVQDIKHAGDPIAHFKGQLDATNKLFGVCDKTFMDNLAVPEQKEQGIRVHPLNTMTVSDERHDKLIIYSISDK